jgi:hypothetical protein
MQSTVSKPTLNKMNCNVNLNNDNIQNISNITDVYTYNRSCAAIDISNQCYVWGRADNNWF